MGKAIESRERALALHEAAGDKVGQAIDHAMLARLFTQEDKPEEALVHISQAEPFIKINGDPKLQVDLFRVKGTAYLAAGQFEESIEAYNVAANAMSSLNDESGEAEVYTSIGWAYQSLGDIPQAITAYQKARGLFIKVGNKDGEVRTRLGIGSLYQSLGEFRMATEQYRMLIPDASEEQLARMLVSVAEIYRSHNEFSVAIDAYGKALALVQTPGNPALEGAILAGMGRCRMAQYFLKEAQDDFERARKKMIEAGSRAGEAGVIASIGELSYWTAVSRPAADPTWKFSDALKSYNQALPMMRAVDDRGGEIGVLTNIGLVYDAWGRSSQALRYYLEALQKMEELQTSSRLEEFRIDLADQAARLYERAILLEVSMNHTREAFDLSERARARTYLDQLGNDRISMQKSRLPVDFSKREDELRRENVLLERRLGQELSKSGPEVNPEEISALQTRLSMIRKEYEDRLIQLKLSSPEYAGFLSIPPLNAHEVQEQLSPDVTMLSYFTTPGMTLAFVVTRDSIHVAKLPVSELELYVAVTSFRDFAGQNEMSPSLKSLYKQLIAPIRSRIKTSKLAVVPHGVLHDLPFAALSPDGKSYLNDSHEMFYLPSASALSYIRARTKPGGSRILVMANDEGDGLPRLTHAYHEANAVASLFGTQAVVGDAATLAVLQAHAGEYDILHVIAHINHNRKDPQFSRVMVGQGSDGSLDMHEVFGLDLQKTNLVVLSGCESGIGKRSRGDDVIGLSRAFIYAGSPSVVGSLWSVDDDATQLLMIAFYTHLKEGLSKVEALRSAQADVRRKYPHPYYWAGFVLTGDPGETVASNLVASSGK